MTAGESRCVTARADSLTNWLSCAPRSVSWKTSPLLVSSWCWNRHTLDIGHTLFVVLLAPSQDQSFKSKTIPSLWRLPSPIPKRCASRITPFHLYWVLPGCDRSVYSFLLRCFHLSTIPRRDFGFLFFFKWCMNFFKSSLDVLGQIVYENSGKSFFWSRCSFTLLPMLWSRGMINFNPLLLLHICRLNLDPVQLNFWAIGVRKIADAFAGLRFVILDLLPFNESLVDHDCSKETMVDVLPPVRPGSGLTSHGLVSLAIKQPLLQGRDFKGSIHCFEDGWRTWTRDCSVRIQVLWTRIG